MESDLTLRLNTSVRFTVEANSPGTAWLGARPAFSRQIVTLQDSLRRGDDRGDIGAREGDRVRSVAVVEPTRVDRSPLPVSTRQPSISIGVPGAIMML